MKSPLAGIAAVLLLVFFVYRAEVINLNYSAGEDGFHLRYSIPLLGLGRVDLKDPAGPPDSIGLRLMFIKLATIQLGLASIDSQAAQPVVTVNYEIASRFVKEPLAGTVSLPFGQAGLRARLFSKRLFPAKQGDADIRVLMTGKKAQFDIALDMQNLQGHWEGETDGDNNSLQRSLTLENITLADLNLTVTPLAALLTRVNYSLSINSAALLGGLDNESTNYTGSLLLPNGSYQVWYTGLE